MESLGELIGKIEGPLLFAVKDNYNRLSSIKNLGMAMTSLLGHLTDAMNHNVSLAQKDELNRLTIVLANLFILYDGLPTERKKDRISEAIHHLSEIKTLLKNSYDEKKEKMRFSSIDDKRNVSDLLSKSIRSARGIGTSITALLAKIKLFTIEDMLYFLPRRYEDRRTVCRINQAVSGVKQTISGEIILTELQRYGKKRIFQITVDDGHGILKAKWFKGREAFFRAIFKSGRRVILTGEVMGSPFEKEMIHPDFEILNPNEDQLLHFKRIVPIYSETEGLHQKTIRRIMWKLVRDYSHLLKSPIPEKISINRRLIPLSEAIRQAHFPDVDQDIDIFQKGRSDAHRTLIYDEFFYFQLGMALRKRGEDLEQGIVFRKGGALLKNFYEMLPFSLTSAQQRVIAEIEHDMTSLRRMNRLLQGDVGSGKTVVSAAAMIVACENGYQCAMMAPTEILAGQHYRNLKIFSEKIGLRIGLLTGNLKTTEKKDLQARISNGEIDIAVGTHALIQSGVTYKNLGLAVIDEQHRFGVVQRGELRKKGFLPDVLVMTATPIPRTLAMTVYGDLDVSVIDEMPPGKKTIRTKVFFEAQRDRVYDIIRREIQKGNQVFVVYPLVEESENLSLKDATRMADHLRRDVFPDVPVGLIHGHMQGAEKDQIMADFIGKRTRILVATTVIEVGIDIPSASLMVIEHAERFGLSQLHQLRGRVGRSDIPSFCILLVQHNGSGDAQKRLRIMEETSDGFRIAEEDLRIRGPGEFMGTRQSGIPDFRVANIIRDGRILGDAKNDAFALVDEDPRLERPDHLLLKEELFRRLGNRLDLAKAG